MLRTQLIKYTSHILLILSCFLLLSASLSRVAWCFDIQNTQDTESILVPFECLYNVNNCQSTLGNIQSQRNEPVQDECQFCIEYTFADITPIGLNERQVHSDISGMVLALYQPRPIETQQLVMNQAKHFQKIHLPALSSEKTLKSTILLL
ncbi:MAG: hypothetical protein ACI8PB_003811 [Desulforhopalus sp.]|jgi:hypothetical protein